MRATLATSRRTIHVYATYALEDAEPIGFENGSDRPALDSALTFIPAQMVMRVYAGQNGTLDVTAALSGRSGRPVVRYGQPGSPVPEWILQLARDEAAKA